MSLDAKKHIRDNILIIDRFYIALFSTLQLQTDNILTAVFYIMIYIGYECVGGLVLVHWSVNANRFLRNKN